MALMHSRRSDGNLSGKSGTVWTSALAWEMTESIADSMLPADATLGLTAEASPDPVNTVAVVAGVSNGGSASEPPVALFCSWWLVASSRCGFDIMIFDPCIRSASSDVLLVFGGLLQPHVSCQSLSPVELRLPCVYVNNTSILLTYFVSNIVLWHFGTLRLRTFQNCRNCLSRGWQISTLSHS